MRPAAPRATARHPAHRRRGADRLRADGAHVRRGARGHCAGHHGARQGARERVPLACVVSRKDISDAQPAGSMGGTYAGNAVACAAALATLDVFADERLVENAAARGAQLLAGLRPLVHASGPVADARGLGLMVAVEFAEAAPKGTAARVVEAARERSAAADGLLLRAVGSCAPRRDRLRGGRSRAHRARQRARRLPDAAIAAIAEAQRGGDLANRPPPRAHHHVARTRMKMAGKTNARDTTDARAHSRRRPRRGTEGAREAAARRSHARPAEAAGVGELQVVRGDARGGAVQELHRDRRAQWRGQVQPHGRHQVRARDRSSGRVRVALRASCRSRVRNSFVLGVRTTHLRGSQLRDLVFGANTGGPSAGRRARVTLVYEAEDGTETRFTRAIVGTSRWALRWRLPRRAAALDLMAVHARSPASTASAPGRSPTATTSARCGS